MPFASVEVMDETLVANITGVDGATLRLNRERGVRAVEATTTARPSGDAPKEPVGAEPTKLDPKNRIAESLPKLGS